MQDLTCIDRSVKGLDVDDAKGLDVEDIDVEYLDVKDLDVVVGPRLSSHL